jgi:hypothetical protein
MGHTDLPHVLTHQAEATILAVSAEWYSAEHFQIEHAIEGQCLEE